MKLNNTFAAVLNIKEGESRPIFFLMMISFFMGTAIAFFYTATTAMFLASFSTLMLPYAYIGSGIIGYLIWVVSSRLSKKCSLPSMLIIYMSFLAISVLLFFVGIELYNQNWLPMLMFIWIRVFTYISTIVFWTLAGNIFDLRQGKRLFGLISAGEVISTIIGFFSIPFILVYIEVPDLIIISLAGLISCLIVLVLTIRRYKDKLVTVVSESKSKTNSGKTFRDLFKNSYFKCMFALAILPMFSIYFVDYIFLTQTKIEYPDKNFIAGFLGIFFGIAAVIEFVFKTFLSGRVISKYGLKPGLSALPATMLVTTLLAAVSGSIFGLAGFFYSFLALTKFSERVLRSSISEPTFQILYQPLPAEERLSFQNRIEGGPKAFGNIAGGFVLLIFSHFSFISIVHYNYLFLLVLIFWVRIAFNMYREYRESLRKLIDKKVPKSIGSIEDETDLTEFFQNLVSSNPKELPVIFNLYENVNSIKAEASLIRLLMQSNQNIGPGVLKIVSENKYIAAIPVFEYCLNDEELLPLRNELESTLINLKIFRSIKFEEICKMSVSDDHFIREEAARLFGYASKYNAVNFLQQLIKDKSVPVRRAALISAGRLKRTELWSDIIESLNIYSLSNAATSAIKNIGDAILPELEKYINRTAVDKTILKRVIKIYGSIAGEKASNYLLKRIDYPDKDIREQVLLSLRKAGFHAGSKEQQLFKEMIKREIEIIIWIMAAISDIKTSPDTSKLETALLKEMDLKKNILFSILSLLYDSHTIQLVRESINSANPNSRTYGLEIIDLMVSPELKEILIPLLEENTISENIERYKFLYPQQQLTVDNRLTDIINKEYDQISLWVKTCAIELIPTYRNDDSLNILGANLMHKDLLIREVSALALYQMSPDCFSEITNRLPKRERNNYSELNYKIQISENNEALFISGKIKLLKEVIFFSEVSEKVLKEIIINTREVFLEQNQFCKICSDNKQYVYFLLTGSVITHNGILISGADIISDLYTPIVSFKAVEDSVLLQIETDLMFELMADYTELAKCMLQHINTKTILD